MQDAPRPELAGRSQSANTIPVKKTRTVAGARKEPAAKTARGTKKIAATTGNTKATGNPVQQAEGAARSGTDDVDNLTSGMKKIKINLITQSQREAKERSQTQGTGSGVPTPSESRSTRSGRSTPLVSPDMELPSIPPPYADKMEVSTPTALPASDPVYPTFHGKASVDTSGGESSEARVETPNQEDNGSLPASSPIVPQVSVQPSMDSPDVFIPYQPEGPPPMAAAQNEPLKWLPPNVSTPSSNTPVATPSPVKRQDNLFHYTPGSIPFAPRPKSPLKPDMPSHEEVKNEDLPQAD